MQKAVSLMMMFIRQANHIRYSLLSAGESNKEFFIISKGMGAKLLEI